MPANSMCELGRLFHIHDILLTFSASQTHDSPLGCASVGLFRLNLCHKDPVHGGAGGQLMKLIAATRIRFVDYVFRLSRSMYTFYQTPTHQNLAS